MSRGLLVISLIFALSAGAVSAQTPPLDPIGTLEAGDFRALAVTVDGDRLLVADAQNTQVRIYDFTDPSKPAPLSESEVSGTPILLAGGEDFGLVAETTDGETDAVETVTPPLPGLNAQYAPGAYVEIDKNPFALALSPDNHWGLVLSTRGYTLMQINNASDITSYQVSETLEGAALSNSTAYLLRNQNLEAASLDKLEAMHADQVLGLDGNPTLVALSDGATSGVVVLDDNHLVFFDPAKLTKTGEFTVNGAPITSVHFLSKGSDAFLLITQQNSNSIAILNVADPANVAALPSTQPLSKPIRALAVYKALVIVTDGVTVRIFSA